MNNREYMCFLLYDVSSINWDQWDDLGLDEFYGLPNYIKQHTTNINSTFISISSSLAVNDHLKHNNSYLIKVYSTDSQRILKLFCMSNTILLL